MNTSGRRAHVHLNVGTILASSRVAVYRRVRATLVDALSKYQVERIRARNASA